MEKNASIYPSAYNTNNNGTVNSRNSSEHRSDSLADDSEPSDRVPRASSSCASVAQSPAAFSAHQSAASSFSPAEDDYLLQTPISFANRSTVDAQPLNRNHHCTPVPMDRDATTGMSLGDQVFFPVPNSEAIYFGVVRWIGYFHTCSRVRDYNILFAGIELVLVLVPILQLLIVVISFSCDDNSIRSSRTTTTAAVGTACTAPSSSSPVPLDELLFFLWTNSILVMVLLIVLFAV